MAGTVAPPVGVDGCREVGAGEVAAVRRVLASDPFVGAPAAEHVLGIGRSEPADGLFLTRGGPDRSLVFIAGSVLPLVGATGDLEALGREVVRAGVGPMSVHGRRPLVEAVRPALEAGWGPAREIRESQHLMVLEGPVDPALALPSVRQASLREFEPVLHAAAAMYREELGADPFAVGAGVPFRRRVARSVARGRTWVAVERGEVVFKADVAAISGEVAQLQGIWVDPRARGRGLGSEGTAAVCAALQAEGLVPSLVVNDSNIPARRAYRRIGMTDHVDYATVLM